MIASIKFPLSFSRRRGSDMDFKTTGINCRGKRFGINLEKREGGNIKGPD